MQIWSTESRWSSFVWPEIVGGNILEDELANQSVGHILTNMENNWITSRAPESINNTN